MVNWIDKARQFTPLFDNKKQMQMGKILFIYLVAMILGGITGFTCSLLMLSIKLLSQTWAFLGQIAIAHDWPVAWLSALVASFMVYLAWWMTVRFAPEASGSGIPIIEAALVHKRKIQHQFKLLPVKFVGAVLAISVKMVLGREGPSVQIGGYLGAIFGNGFKFQRMHRDALISAGAAAGLAAAFNAPLAGVLFFLEELRQHFNFSFTHFKMVALACVTATLVLRLMIGNHPAIEMPIYASPSLSSFSVFFVFGMLIGVVGILYNISLIKTLDIMDKLTPKMRRMSVWMIGFIVGYLAYRQPAWVGGGYDIIAKAVHFTSGIDAICWLLVIRFILSMLCYGSGVPGGIFAPILALGTLCGVLMYQCIPMTWLDAGTQQGMFAVAGMGGLFSATVRAPLTGIVLVVEMTQNYSLILPLMVTCLTATTVNQCFKNAPIYSQLCRRMLESRP